MPQSDNPFYSTRQSADNNQQGGQARNRHWWETKPMTYAEWDAEERIPKTPEELKQIEDTLFSASPFLREEMNFTALKGKRVLDLGCGSGVLSCKIAREGAEVFSVDLTQAAIDMARRNARAQGLALGLTRSDAENLPFASDSFDYVFSWGVLHHTSNMDQALSSVFRILAPGGAGLMMVYHKNSIVYYLHGLYWLIFKGKIFSGHTLTSVQDFYTDGYYHRYLTPAQLSSRLLEAGLKPTCFHITQYQKKILPLIPVWFDRWLKKKFGMCLVAEFEKPAPPPVNR